MQIELWYVNISAFQLHVLTYGDIFTTFVHLLYADISSDAD